jgi:hypothetical protein
VVDARAYRRGLSGFDRLHADPRFTALQERLGLPSFVACGDSIEFKEVTVMKTHRIVALSVLGLLGLAGASAAETIALKGRSTWTPVSETSVKLADGRTVQRQVLRGTALNDNPNTPLSNASQDCMFTTVTSADGKSFSSGGYCDGLDADGDVYWAYGSATELGG